VSIAGLPFAPVLAMETAEVALAENLSDLLPPALLRECDQCPVLAHYVRSLPLDEVGVPEYYPKLSRDLQKLKHRNLIYPIKDGLYVHIYPDSKGERDYYITIEPDLLLDVDTLTDEVEKHLVEYAEEIGKTTNDDEKREALLRVLDEICTTDPDERSDRVKVTPQEMEAVRYHVLRQKMGMGALQPLLQDPYIEDISCSGVGPVFIEHKIFRSLQSSIVFTCLDELDDFVVWMGECIKRPVTVRNPIVDAVLPDGSRINIVYGREISSRGSNFTIRKFSDTPISVLELIEFGTMNYVMAAYLSFALEEDMNLFVAGATASGKTTTLNAITTFILPDAKIVTIEDTPEVQVPHKNWVREVTRGAGTQGEKGGEVNMMDLLKAALRQRPDRIVVGEIRGEEGRIAFQAMQTGHGVLSTFHAASVEKLIQRLTGDPINVPKTYIDNLNVVVIQAAVRGLDGKRVRRVLSISEIVGYDPAEESFSFIEAFRWNPATDVFEFPGNMNSFLLEERIAPKRGLAPEDRKKIYTELRKRATVFEKIHREMGMRSFDDFFRLLAEAHKQNLL
jgi:flagellar protein FlaI